MNAPADSAAMCVESYGRLKNLKLVGTELGMPWQTVYVYLKRAGVAVTGDKTRYGSDTDRLAARAEREFQRLVPDAINTNDQQFQSKVDFVIHGYLIDVKASLLRGQGPATKAKRWAFSVKKQEMVADFIVCFALQDEGYRTLLIPGDLLRRFQSISLAGRGGSKWWDYEVQPHSLAEFFKSLPTKETP